MGTFLVTPKMSPELAARVEASVRGRPIRVRSKASPGAVILWRTVTLVAIAGLVVWLVLLQRQQHDALDSGRRSLLEQVQRQSGALTERQRTIVVRSEALLARLAGPYEGDRVADELRSSPGLAEVLARPMIYVRGPIAGFASTVGLATLAEASYRDAFVLCLLDPPADRTEKTLRVRARAASAGGARVAAVAHVERLHSVLAGVPLLLTPWEDRVRQASDAKELAGLREDFLHAHLADAVRAAKARVLLVAMDEPKVGNGPTELDGACPHYARVTIVDLETDAPLLRARKLIDPGWISEDSRVQWSSGIIGCELALEVRADATGIPAPQR